MILLVGRPNVGKSTLFNRLLGFRKAIVSTDCGTTRDLLYARLEWARQVLTLVDAGGLQLDRSEGILACVQRQVCRALKEADIFLFVCDGKVGLLPADELILERLRQEGKPILLAVNKLDQGGMVPSEFYRLGLSEVFGVSALHGHRIGPLLDALAQPWTQVSDAAIKKEPYLRVAIVGRQNVGKSSFLNQLLQYERAIVYERPGTTRDALEGTLVLDGRSILLVDTAGLRHRRKVKEPVDTFSMSRALQALSRADVALLILDATEGFTRDDQRILLKICESGCGVVILLNKWDLVRKIRERDMAESIYRENPSAKFAPVLAVSAKTGYQVSKSIALVESVGKAMRKAVSEEELLTQVRLAWKSQSPPRYLGRPIQLQRLRWIPGRPQTVELTLSPIGWLPKPYQHYLLKRLRHKRGIDGVPLQLSLQGKKIDGAKKGRS
ncbi:MAG: ribosome biogenesis GTPase Der [Candidatus Omnitrophica bacterium]|nr:ribosome biogenesis GTPase Der [Candidatus Omnitrophota bacterium]